MRGILAPTKGFNHHSPTLPTQRPVHSMPKRAAPAAAAEVVTTPATKQQRLVQAAAPHPDWRLELFFKSPQELDKQLPFLKLHGLMHLNITNKAAADDLLGVLAQLTSGLLGHGPQQQQQQQQGSPGGTTPTAAAATVLDVCLHYSLKYNYDKTPERSLNRLLDFCNALQQQQQKQQGPLQMQVHVLLVSGGGKKKRFDTVAALQALQQLQQQQQQGASNAGPNDKTEGHQGATSRGSARVTALLLPSLAVAFNPYLPGAAEAAEERRRLKAKLQTGLVDRVYLQMGTDLQRLQSGLDYLQQLQQELASSSHTSSQSPRGLNSKPLQLLGSVFLPSKRLLAQMRFRPWNGVFLSEQYLSSVEAAESITRDLLAVYAAAGVVPLLESAVKTDDELQRARQLLAAAGASADK